MLFYTCIHILHIKHGHYGNLEPFMILPVIHIIIIIVWCVMHPYTTFTESLMSFIKLPDLHIKYLLFIVYHILKLQNNEVKETHKNNS